MKKTSTTLTGKMNTCIKFPLFFAFALSFSFLLHAGGVKKEMTDLYKVEKRGDIIALFPKTTTDIETRLKEAKARIYRQIEELKVAIAKETSFESAVLKWDKIEGLYQNDKDIFLAIGNVHTDPAAREAADKARVELEEYFVQKVLDTPEMYEALNFLERHQETVPSDKKLIISELKAKLRRYGLCLTPERRSKVRDLQYELANLSAAFARNIANDKSAIWVTYQDLYGLDQEFISELEKKEGHYKLTCDYPTYTYVMQCCKSALVRKRLYETFHNRAYPANEAVLEAIIYKRDEFAKELGFYSFAEYILSQEMVKSEVGAENFIDDMAIKCQEVAAKEFKEIASNLPEGVYLGLDQKLEASDLAYVTYQYKKKKFQLDERVVAEYFPMEKTLQGLMHIYEVFFNLQIKKISIKGGIFGLNAIEALEIVSRKDGHLLGYILLDLYPREGKFSHACLNPLIPPSIGQEGDRSPGINLLIANFTKSTKEKPSLLKHDEVVTFFHEFGHAIHDLFSATDMLITAGCRNVKYDFVEMPSQLLEEWMYDPAILKMVSCHYLTKEPLPDSLIDAIGKVKDFNAGITYLRQCMLSKLSLEFFKEGAKKNTNILEHKIREQFSPFFSYPDSLHSHFSFGHLDEYGPRYYGYMWAEVFAADLFTKIKKEGLLNPEVGEKYVLDILGRGSSDDPSLMLERFLKRKPSTESFMQKLRGEM